MVALSGWDGLTSTQHSSGTMTDGITRTAERPLRSQVVPKLVLVRLAGSASQPTGRLAGVSLCAAAQTGSGIEISTRYRLSGSPPATRRTSVSRQASERLSAA